MAADVCRCLRFDQIAEFREAAANANILVVQAWHNNAPIEVCIKKNPAPSCAMLFT
jgi:hypothetical protein